MAELLTTALYLEWRDVIDQNRDYEFAYRAELAEPFTCKHRASGEEITGANLPEFKQRLREFDHDYHAGTADNQSETVT